MGKGAALTRKSFFVDARAVRRAKRALGVATEAEAVRLSVERIAEMEALWRFLRKSRATLTPGSFETP
jgi:hypothetical protein